MTINYEPLREYMRSHRLTGQHLAETGGVDKSTISRYMSAGRPMPTEVILRWQAEYGWSVAETAWYCLGGPMPVCRELIVTPEELEILKALETLRSVLK